MTDEQAKRRREVERKRRERNAEIASAVRAGEYVPPPVDMGQVFFPQRPQVLKDRREMARVYGEGET